MGWVNDEAPSCEGYVVGMVPIELPNERSGACSVLPRFQSEEAWPLRELDRRDEHAVLNVGLVRVACTCGWRSRVLRARAEFHPSVTWLPDRQEDAAAEIWQEHIKHNVSASALFERARRAAVR